MKQWVGRWLMGVSLLHTLFALVVFGDVLLSIARDGVFDAVRPDPMRAAVAWFVLFGALLFMFGLAVSALEKAGAGVLPKSLGWSTLALATAGVVLMPTSGFWLAFPPAIAVLLRKPANRLPQAAT